MQAAKDFNIDLTESIMIGDSRRDVEAGVNAGIKKCYLIDNSESNSLLSVVKKLI